MWAVVYEACAAASLNAAPIAQRLQFNLGMYALCLVEVHECLYFCAQIIRVGASVTVEGYAFENNPKQFRVNMVVIESCEPMKRCSPFRLQWTLFPVQ
jgi:hypothetical protein